MNQLTSPGKPLNHPGSATGNNGMKVTSANVVM